MRFLKKNFLFIVVISLLYAWNITTCSAASASVSISSSASKVVVGNTITYTVKVSSSTPLGSLVYKFDYDTSKLTLVSGTLNNTYVIQNDSTKSTTFTFKFKAKASGTATVSFILNEAIDFYGNPYTVNKTTSKSITIITQQQLEDSYSKNNYLSSLGVDGYVLSPSFNKDTLEYSLTLENDVRSINITGAKDDSRSSVSGLGNHELVEGINKIEIKVTAQNGSTRSYILNVTVKELSPIVVELDGKNYNVVRKKELITIPNSSYEETTIKINDEDVPAFINNVTKVTLVGLTDENGDVSLYSYKDNTYSLYKEFSFNKIIVTEEKLNKIPQGYKEVKIVINEKELTAYQNDESSNFYLVYATNIENGLTNLYQYDSKENTLQLFNQKENDKKVEIEEKNKIYEYIIIGLGSLLVVTYLYILVTTLKNNNRKEGKKREELSKEKKKSFTENVDNLNISMEEGTQINKKDDKIEEDISNKVERKQMKTKKK